MTWRASASYVTGAQSMKFGYQGGYIYDNGYTYTNDSVPGLTASTAACRTRSPRTSTPFPANQRVRYDAFYAQEQWTLGRMTLQGALALRPRLELLPRADGRRACASCRRPITYPRHRRRHRLQGHHAARGRRRRRVRQRQDVDQGQRRQVPAGAQERSGLHRAETRRPPDDQPRRGRGPTPTAISCPTAIC